MISWVPIRLTPTNRPVIGLLVTADAEYEDALLNQFFPSVEYKQVGEKTTYTPYLFTAIHLTGQVKVPGCVEI
jgi:hypothetical protein